MVTLTATGETVGLFQVRRLDPVFEGGECECTLVPHARGKGVFRDAAALVAGFAFGVVGVHRLEARVLVQNGRANGALRKIGAVQEGVLRRAVRQGGQYADQVMWSMLKDDWAARRPGEAPHVH
jgi:RimJ/RimL family protein N-acetyltransferase